MIATILMATNAFTRAQAETPNIVYIMADDLGYGDVGCFGQKKIPTPNIDQLAKEGIKMTRSYSASAVCAPTRCSLLTGRHQGHASIRGNRENGGFGPNDPEGQTALPASDLTIAQILKGQGYTTGIVGKWGLGGPAPGESPLDHGFEFFYGYLCQRRAHNYYPAYLWKNRQPDLLGNRVFDAHQRISAPLENDDAYYAKYQDNTYSPTRLMEACTGFIRNSAKQPFFLYYAPTLPHVALQAPVDWINHFPKEWDPKPYLGAGGYLPTPRPHATYAAMIAYLDYTIGQVIKALRETGNEQKTLIIVTSDNGPTTAGGVDPTFFNSAGGLRGGKMDLYEGGIRMPFVARWPGRIPAGTVSNHVNVCYDAMATLCDVVGVPSPKTDGLSYLPALLGKKQPTRDYVYFEYPEASSMRAVLIGNMKVIQSDLMKHRDRFEVYDLDMDPTESRDLSSSRTDIVSKAKEIFAKEHRQNAMFPLPGVDVANR